MTNHRMSSKWIPLIVLQCLLLAACGDEEGGTGSPPTGNGSGAATLTINGNPPTSVMQGVTYTFTPSTNGSNGGLISFEIANKPPWATFDTDTGRLEGIPDSSDIGVYANITISASSGDASASLPSFTVAVRETISNTPPSISGEPPTEIEAGKPYHFQPEADDADGDALIFSIQNRPSWASFETETGLLEGIPDDDHLATYSEIRITVSDGHLSASLPAFDIKVGPRIEKGDGDGGDAGDGTGSGGAGDDDPNQPPTISGSPPTTAVRGELYSFTPSASDPDGDALTFSISGRPLWATFNAATGELRGTPSWWSRSVYEDIVIAVSDGSASASLPPFDLSVVSSAGGGGDGDSGGNNGDDDGGDGDSGGNNGDDDGGDGDSGGNNGDDDGGDGDSGGNNGDDESGDGDSGGNGDDDGGDEEINSPPVISGNPPATIDQGQLYDFTPTASDADGDALTFSVANAPAWTSFNASTGRLSGVPEAADVGTHTNVVLSVTDGHASASLAPFSITVEAANAPPTISGNPPAEVVQDQFYSFTPSASDPDGDELAFSVTNAPPWASFNSTTGRLSGSPAAADLGTYGNIVISVSDGQDTASLPPFGITVVAVTTGSATVNWQPPDSRADGTPLLPSEIAGYTIYWGTEEGAYPNSVDIADVGITSYVIDNLTPDTYYFVTTATDTTGLESGHSNTGMKTIP